MKKRDCFFDNGQYKCGKGNLKGQVPIISVLEPDTEPQAGDRVSMGNCDILPEQMPIPEHLQWVENGWSLEERPIES